MPTDEVFDRIRKRGFEAKFSELAAMHSATLEDICGRTKFAHVIRARASVYRWLRFELNWSYPAIGWLFNRDHTGVMYLVKKNEPPEIVVGLSDVVE
jgi:chromosomal replication initiation ATPase DnaA